MSLASRPLLEKPALTPTGLRLEGDEPEDPEEEVEACEYQGAFEGLSVLAQLSVTGCLEALKQITGNCDAPFLAPEDMEAQEEVKEQPKRKAIA